MRSVYRHQNSTKMPKKTRRSLFIAQFSDTPESLLHFNRRYKAENKFNSNKRVKFTLSTEKLIPSSIATKRGTTRIRRNSKRIKHNTEGIFRAAAALIRCGLLKSSGKYDQFQRLHREMSMGTDSYGTSAAQYPKEAKVKELAYAIYNHPNLITNAPDWVLRYRKGRSKIADDKIFLPSDQLTLSQICGDDYPTEDDVTTRIIETLNAASHTPEVVKVRKCSQSNTIAAYIYFTSAYEARSAIPVLKVLGRVSIGRTIVTARIVASKVIDAVNLLLSEADGPLPLDTRYERARTTTNYELHLQEWIDKDGRVTFILSLIHI